MTLYPSTGTKLTAGIDAQDVAPIIGQQWYSWNYNTVRVLGKPVWLSFIVCEPLRVTDFGTHARAWT